MRSGTSLGMVAAAALAVVCCAAGPLIAGVGLAAVGAWLGHGWWLVLVAVAAVCAAAVGSLRLGRRSRSAGGDRRDGGANRRTRP